MRVVVVHNRYRSALPSGENEVVDTEIALLRAAGVEVTPYLRDSDEVAGFGPLARATLPARPVYSLPDAVAVRRLIARDRPDVLHLHNPYPLISPAVVRVAHRAGVPVVQTVHNYRHVCLNGTHQRAAAACFECGPGRLAVPGIRHACYRDSRLQSAVLAASLRSHRATFRSVDRYLALNAGMAEHLRRFGIPAERITVKANTVPDPGPDLAPDPRGFVFVGRLAPEKGLRLLLDAWGRTPPYALGPLTIVGDGPDRPIAEAAARDRGDVRVLGRQPRSAVYDAVRGARVLVVPSTWPEPFGRVAVEAFALGRPVLATAVGGLPDVVGDAGWLVDPRPDALAAALADAAGRDLAALSAAARDRYERVFSPAAVQRQLLDVYDEVATSRVG